MKIKELKQKSEKELRDLLTECREKLFSLTSNLSRKQVKDVSQVNKTRKDIARVLTIVREKFQFYRGIEV